MDKVNSCLVVNYYSETVQIPQPSQPLRPFPYPQPFNPIKPSSLFSCTPWLPRKHSTMTTRVHEIILNWIVPFSTDLSHPQIIISRQFSTESLNNKPMIQPKKPLSTRRHPYQKNVYLWSEEGYLKGNSSNGLWYRPKNNEGTSIHKWGQVVVGGVPVVDRVRKASVGRGRYDTMQTFVEFGIPACFVLLIQQFPHLPILVTHTGYFLTASKSGKGGIWGITGQM